MVCLGQEGKADNNSHRNASWNTLFQNWDCVFSLLKVRGELRESPGHPELLWAGLSNRWHPQLFLLKLGHSL